MAYESYKDKQQAREQLALQQQPQIIKQNLQNRQYGQILIDMAIVQAAINRLQDIDAVNDGTISILDALILLQRYHNKEGTFSDDDLNIQSMHSAMSLYFNAHPHKTLKLSNKILQRYITEEIADRRDAIKKEEKELKEGNATKVKTDKESKCLEKNIMEMRTQDTELKEHPLQLNNYTEQHSHVSENFNRSPRNTQKVLITKQHTQLAKRNMRKGDRSNRKQTFQSIQ